jgi:SAM-dependent methyltransferase
MRWGGFADRVAPLIRAYYETTDVGMRNHTLLDLCCGTGQLALHFLEHGYQVLGLDLSPGMLAHARENAAPYIADGKARFIEGDAADYEVPGTYGLAVATFDALNHLPDMVSLEGCFVSTYQALVEGGVFIFDLNTRAGLQSWSGVTVQDSDALMLIIRGVVSNWEGRAYTQISGFLRQDNGLYKRFNEVMYNTIFDLDEVATALEDAGFTDITLARSEALDTPLEAPEQAHRVFFIARA